MNTSSEVHSSILCKDRGMLATSEEMIADNEAGGYEEDLCKWKALFTFSRFLLYQPGISEEQ